MCGEGCCGVGGGCSIPTSKVKPQNCEDLVSPSGTAGPTTSINTGPARKKVIKLFPASLVLLGCSLRHKMINRE